MVKGSLTNDTDDTAYLLGDAGPPRRARFDHAPGIVYGGDTDPTNAADDPKTRALESCTRYRAMGDCGHIETWAWDGVRFRLTRAGAMRECRGAVAYIGVWTARMQRE